jgi:hypothetical protein
MKIAHEEISKRAHQLWEEAGCPQEGEQLFWLEAESQLMREDKENPDISDNDPAVLRSPRYENL